MTKDRRRHPLRLAGAAVALALATTGSAAAQVSRTWFGPSVRVYPAGIVTEGVIEVPLGRGSWNAVLSGGYNGARRGHFGRHDDERGGGPGLALGLDRRLGPPSSGWLIGVRLDWWWLGIDWTDRSPERRGHTSVRVLQPTARVGYGWTVFRGRARLEGSVGLGAEINVRTDGEPVGQGAIGLVGVSLLWHP